MKYLLDANVISDLYDSSSKTHQKIVNRLNQLTNQDSIAISIVTIYELEYAYANAPEQKQRIIRSDINHLKAHFEILSLSIASANYFGDLKMQFKNSRMINQENMKKHTLDIMLASCAITEERTLISSDKIFPILKQLSIKFDMEDWTL